MSPRQRPLILSIAGLALAWILAYSGFSLVRSLKPTPDKVRALIRSNDLASLTPEQRRNVLRKLAALLNQLSPEDRRTARMTPEWRAFLSQMSDAEKGDLLEQTLPSGVNQMLAAFEQMPENKRRQAIEDSVRRLREARLQADPDAAPSTNGMLEGMDLTPELREKVVSTGLKTFMDQGSADSKAQLQPLLEELQRSMESGRGFPRRRPPAPK
jgi:hypothetical protein